MNRLTLEVRARILGCLVEGNSMRATSRMVDVSINTVTKLLVDVGIACSEYQDKTLRNLKCKRVQVDEIWSFCYSKAKNVPAEKKGILGYGDVYTWVAICADSKIVPSWLVGQRDAEYANIIISDMASRLSNRIQLTTDGYKAYLSAVESAFGANVDYAMLVKLYGAPQGSEQERRYSSGNAAARSPVRYVATLKKPISLQAMRLTNGFSKKIENHEHALALHYMYYNFGRIHKTLRVTPAMEAGIADHIWTLEEIAKLAN